jgi:hypothetical protein
VAVSVVRFPGPVSTLEQVEDDYLAPRDWLGRWSSFRAVALHETMDALTDQQLSLVSRLSPPIVGMNCKRNGRPQTTKPGARATGLMSCRQANGAADQ